MGLTDTRIRNAKPPTKAYKLSDGGGMYLLITPDGGRYWRLDYRFAAKRRTLALGYFRPCRSRGGTRCAAMKHEDYSTKDMIPKQRRKHQNVRLSLRTKTPSKLFAREWIGNQRHRLASRYLALAPCPRLEADIFPHIGSRPIAEIDAPELLDALKTVEKRGVIETARRLRQICGQVFRYAVASGRARHDPSARPEGRTQIARQTTRPQGDAASRSWQLF